MKYASKLLVFLVPLLAFLCLASVASPQASREPKLIRDTDVAEENDGHEAEAAKEPDPALAAQNVNIGNYYLKQKNYVAAIQRYLEAIEYQADLIPAHEGLARAYEKKGDILEAINAYKGFLKKNPDSPKASDFRTRIAKLERKIN